MTLRTVRIDTWAVPARAGALAAVARSSRRKTRNVARELNTANAGWTPLGQSREVVLVGKVVDVLVGIRSSYLSGSTPAPGSIRPVAGMGRPRLGASAGSRRYSRGPDPCRCPSTGGGHRSPRRSIVCVWRRPPAPHDEFHTPNDLRPHRPSATAWCSAASQRRRWRRLACRCAIRPAPLWVRSTGVGFVRGGF